MLPQHGGSTAAVAAGNSGRSAAVAAMSHHRRHRIAYTCIMPAAFSARREQHQDEILSVTLIDGNGNVILNEFVKLEQAV